MNLTLTEAERRIHHIKCWPGVYEEMASGRKTAEFRLNDRDFQVGDDLLIREWCPLTKEYTHREMRRTITHVLADSFGVPQGYAMLSLAALAEKAKPKERPTTGADMVLIPRDLIGAVLGAVSHYNVPATVAVDMLREYSMKPNAIAAGLVVPVEGGK